jgi:hypothetical protein
MKYFSIRHEVTGFFSSTDASGRIMVLGLTQSLTEISTRILSQDLGRSARKADNLHALMVFRVRYEYNSGK